MNVLPDRIIQQFEWGWGTRILWTDGRPPLMDPDLPRWWGYSTAHWDGDTFVVTTTGVDDRTWVDQYGYPHHRGHGARGALYKRTAYDVLELTMTINDPKIYTAPWVSELKKFRKLDKNGIRSIDGWAAACSRMRALPADEVDLFNKRVRDPAGGVIH